MATLTRHTKIRDSRGPRAVEVKSSKDNGRYGSSAQPLKKLPSIRAPKLEPTYYRRVSYQGPSEVFELSVIGQPPRHIALGTPVAISVLISLHGGERGQNVANVDTSRLFAVATLVSDNRNGDRVPLEAGIMTGQRMFDSVRSVPADYAGNYGRSQSYRIALGQFSFPDLLIRQPGSYRIQTTLISLNTASDAGTSIGTVDSDMIKVERRSANTRRNQK